MKVERRNRAAIVLLVAALGLTGACAPEDGVTAPEVETPITFGLLTWTGYAGIVIGVESGLFEDEGLDVSYTLFADPAQRFNALAAGDINAAATTADTLARTNATGIPTVAVLGLDASKGGDGIVAEEDITSVEQLAGKEVAVHDASASLWFFSEILREHGLSLDDVTRVTMTASDAGAAFVAGAVPAAVTWEPHLSQGAERPNGHLLVSSMEYPDLITDHLVFTPEFVEENPETVEAFIRAYGKVMEFIQSSPDEALEYATDYLGQSVDAIKASLETAPLWTLEESAAYYGTGENPGPFYEIYTESGKFWQSVGGIEELADPLEMIDPTFLKNVLAEG